MTKAGFAVAVLAIVGVATWTYNVTYRTKTALERIDRLRAEISAERETLQVLRVEWAWMNNPERLARLTDRHAGSLGLVAMAPESFGDTAYLPGAPDPDAPDAAVAGVLDSRLAAAEAHLAALPGAPMGSAMPLRRPIAWRP